MASKSLFNVLPSVSLLCQICQKEIKRKDKHRTNVDFSGKLRDLAKEWEKLKIPEKDRLASFPGVSDRIMAYYIQGLILCYAHFSWGTSHIVHDVQNRAHLVIIKRWYFGKIRWKWKWNWGNIAQFFFYFKRLISAFPANVMFWKKII